MGTTLPYLLTGLFAPEETTSKANANRGLENSSRHGEQEVVPIQIGPLTTSNMAMMGKMAKSGGCRCQAQEQWASAMGTARRKISFRYECGGLWAERDGKAPSTCTSSGVGAFDESGSHVAEGLG